MQIVSQRGVQVEVLIFVTIALALAAQAAPSYNAGPKRSYRFFDQAVDCQCEHKPVCHRSRKAQESRSVSCGFCFQTPVW